MFLPIYLFIYLLDSEWKFMYNNIFWYQCKLIKLTHSFWFVFRVHMELSGFAIQILIKQIM